MNVSPHHNSMRNEKASAKLISDWRKFPKDLTGGALAIGNFDGVHTGHHIILKHLKDAAERVGGPSVVFTFDPHPLTILRPGFQPDILTPTADRIGLLEQQGIDVVVVCKTDQEFLNLSYRQFFDTVVVETISANAMVEGPNFFFGKDQEGNVDRLRQLCQQQDIGLEIVTPKTKSPTSEELVSSSGIRRFLRQGNVHQASDYLGRNYEIAGTVIHGDGRGRKLGFPTANLSHIEAMLPGSGVYAGVGLVDGIKYPVALNIGKPKTFGVDQDRVEAHFIGLDADLYDKVVRIQFLKKIRDNRPFADVDQLVQQVKKDIAEAKDIYAKAKP